MGARSQLPDITFAGWVPTGFFQQIGQFPADGVTFPIVFDGDEASLVPGHDALAAPGDDSDVDLDGNADIDAIEVRFNSDSTFTTDAAAGNSPAAATERRSHTPRRERVRTGPPQPGRPSRERRVGWWGARSDGVSEGSDGIRS